MERLDNHKCIYFIYIYPSGSVKTAESLGYKSFVGPHMIPGKVYVLS